MNDLIILEFTNASVTQVITEPYIAGHSLPRAVFSHAP